MVVNMIKLKNGITLIFLKNNKKYINIDFSYRVGNKNEKNNQLGFAHLLEHLFLRSTKNKKYLNIMNSLEQNGTQINACTKQEFTHFFMDCLINQFRNSFDLFIDLLLNNFYDNTEYIKTINIVNDEIELYRKSPIDILKDNLNKIIYNCGMRNSITDNRFDIIPSLDDLIAFKNDYYRNNNLVVTVSGKISIRIKNYITRKLNLIQNNKFLESAEKLDLKTSLPLPNKVTTCNRFIIGKRYVCESNTFENFLKLKILGKLLGGSVSSRLFSNLRENNGLVYSVYSYSDMFTNHCTLTNIVYVNHDKYSETVSLLETELSKDCISTINLNEFNKAKKLLCLNFAKEFSINNILSQFISECYQIYSIQLNYTKLIDCINKITYDEFMSFCKNLNDNWYNAIVGY